MRQNVLPACPRHLRLTLLIAALLLTPAAGFADCVNPTGIESEILYNHDYQVMQFCNGTVWVSMASGTVSLDESDPQVGNLTASNWCKANAGATAIDCTSSSISLSTDVSGTLQAAQMPALTGDATNSAGAVATTVGKINGVALGSTTATAGNLLIGSGTAWVTNAVTGDVTISSGGVTAIGSGKVTNAMLAGSIASSKLVGTDIATVGTITSGVWNAGGVTSSGAVQGTAFIPSGSTVPANGVYLPAANKLGFATNSTAALYVDSSQNVGIGTATPAMKLSIGGGADAALRFDGAASSLSSTGNLIYNGSDGNFTFQGGTAGYKFSNNANTATLAVIANGGGLGIGTTGVASTAALDVVSTTKGFLPPRMTTTQRDAISSPATGLTIYNSTTNALNIYNGSAWGAVGAASQWTTTGNDIYYSTGGAGIGTTSVASTAALDVVSTTKGFLPPRMTTTQRDAISSPATGLMIYNTTTAAFEFYTGSAWTPVSGGVPSGTIAAFASASCPAGWSEYTAARGRFLRGIDNGAGNDPDGTRTPGGTQADALGGHTHSADPPNTAVSIGDPGHQHDSARQYDGVGWGPGFYHGAPGNGGYNGIMTATAYTGITASVDIGSFTSGSTGSSETRGKNVALTFCQYAGTSIASSGITASGTANYVARWTSSTVIGTGALYDNGSNVGIGTTSINSWAKLEVNGIISLSSNNGVGYGILTSEASGSPLLLKSRGGNSPDLVVGTSGTVGMGIAPSGSYRLYVDGGAIHGIAGRSTLLGGMGVIGWGDSTNSYGGLFQNTISTKYCYVGTYSAAIACSDTVSDGRLKKDVTALEADEGLAAIMQLRAVHYRWKDPKLNEGQDTEIGFIAQEVEKVLPELVYEAPQGPNPAVKLPGNKSKAVFYQKFVVPLVKAVQELKGLFDALAARVEKLIAQVTGHDEAIKKLQAESETLRKDLNDLRKTFEEFKASPRADNDNAPLPKLRANNDNAPIETKRLETAVGMGAWPKERSDAP